MARVLATVFTYGDNQAMFQESFRMLARSLGQYRRETEATGKPVSGDFLVGFLVIDFTKEGFPRVQKMEGYGFPTEIFFPRPEAGFCSNLNFALKLAKESDVDYLIQVNDDAFVHPAFVYQGVALIKRSGAAFVGGTPQDDGEWNSDIYNVYYPDMVDQTRVVTNFVHGHWEMSACIMDVNKVLGYGGMDERFDEFLGLCGDNDLFLRLAKNGETVLATRLMRFWHGRGITQAKFGRNPHDPQDPIKAGAVAYMKEKWGVDIIKNPTATLGDFQPLWKVVA